MSTLIDQDEFRRTAELVLQASSGEHTMVYLTDVMGGTTRFANNQIVQNLNTHRLSAAIQVAFGRQHGGASTTDLSPGAVRVRVVARHLQ